jgi:hypothetical protein
MLVRPRCRVVECDCCVERNDLPYQQPLFGLEHHVWRTYHLTLCPPILIDLRWWNRYYHSFSHARGSSSWHSLPGPRLVVYPRTWFHEHLQAPPRQNIQDELIALFPDLFTSFELLYPRFITRHHKARRITSSPGSALPSSSLRFPLIIPGLLPTALLTWLIDLQRNLYPAPSPLPSLLPWWRCHWWLKHWALAWPALKNSKPNSAPNCSLCCLAAFLWQIHFTYLTQSPCLRSESSVEFFSMHVAQCLKWSWLFLHLSRFYFLRAFVTSSFESRISRQFLAC